MNESQSPFKLLSKYHANRIVSRDEYVRIRGQLLRRLESRGQVTDEDLRLFTHQAQGKAAAPSAKSYSPSDWTIIILGLLAALVLGYVLYT